MGATQGAGSSNNGSVFEVTPKGEFRQLYSFCSKPKCNDGSDPIAPLIQGSDGNFYGTTSMGGANFEGGTIFEIGSGGTLSTLYSFCYDVSNNDCLDGSVSGPLVQATNGTFYGATEAGGTNCLTIDGCGTVYTLSMGLGPFVEALPNFAKAGATIGILGNNLAGTTAVTFNSTKAAFKVISSTAIEARIPASATTGTIEVTTTGGTLSSNLAFQVLP